MEYSSTPKENELEAKPVIDKQDSITGQEETKKEG